MYVPEHDGELMDAIRVIAETRKMLELGGDVAGLQALDRTLRIQRAAILDTLTVANANHWRHLERSNRKEGS